MNRPAASPPASALPAWLWAWNRFWFTPADPTQLGLIRVLAGALIFYITLTYSYGLFSYVGPHPWMDEAAQDYIRKQAPVGVPENAWGDTPHPGGERGQFFWSIYYHVQDPRWVVAIHASILAVLLLFTAGVWTRVTSVLAWLGALQYVNRLPTSMFGQDTMLIILATYLMIGNSGAALSVDRWLERRRLRRQGLPDAGPRPSQSANFAIRLIQVHFCFVYMVAGLSKLLGSTWWSGTALWFCLANGEFAPLRMRFYHALLLFFCDHLWLWHCALSAIAVFTLFTEVSFPYLVWNRRWRPVMVTCSVLLHLGIGLIMGLVAFSMLMMVMVSSFVPPDQTRAFLQHVGRSLRGRGTTKEPPPRPAPSRGRKEPAVAAT